MLCVKEGSAVKESYTYNEYGKLTARVDNYANLSYTYEYESGLLTKETETGSRTRIKERLNEGIVNYDGERVKQSGIGYTYGNTVNYLQFTDAYNRLLGEETPLGAVSYAYDNLGRIQSRTAYGKTETYTYTANRSDSAYTTGLVSKITYSDGTEITYTYDDNGNILQTGSASYEYDSLNRLIREVAGQKSAAYTYDARGNILTRKEYTNGQLQNSYTYTYSGDRLTKRTCGDLTEATCTYDANGNPTNYFGTALAWTRGRLLASYGSNTFSYNAEGIRYKKNTTEYILDGDRIIAEKESGVITKRYFYDGSGIAGMWYSNAKFTFRKNLQGDVIGIYDEAGTCVGSYSYDPWGVVSASGTMAGVNPFRYRGYYYDTETGLYYLNSRYYDPAVGRFLNADTYSYLEPETLNGLNLYAYALNNPVMYCDPTGHIVISAIITGLIIGAAIGAAIGGTVAGVIAYNNGARGWELFGWTILGIVGGGIIGGAIGAGIGAIWPTLSASIGSFLNSSFVLGSLDVGGELVAISVTGAQLVQAGVVATASGLGYMFYQSKKAAPRIRTGSKKEAYDKAFYKGGKKEPIYHNGKYGKHFHPAGSKYSHWHYYFPAFFGIFGIFDLGGD